MARLRDTRYHGRPARGATVPPRGSVWLSRATAAPRTLMACPRCFALYTRGAEYCGIHGVRLMAVDRDPLLGRLIDHYLIFEHVGDGGLGRVYRAGNIFLEQSVAIKVLWGDLASDRSASERFRLEAQAASMVRHANVVQVMDFGVSGEGLVFMVMELLRGDTLMQILRDQPRFSEARTRNIVRQIAAGLAAAHARGLVHRDLKPANIMLVGDDQVKILDFGLVTFQISPSEDPTRLTRPGEVFGTPAYMAPEQVMGGDFDERTDLYALGAILYQLLSGRPPFEGSIREVMTKHLSTAPESIHGYGPLGRLAMHLLEKLPEHRPESALAVIDSIDRLDPHHVSMPLVRGQPMPSQVSRAVSVPIRRPPPLAKPRLSFEDDFFLDDDDMIAAGIGRRRSSSRVGLWLGAAAVAALIAGAVVTRDQWIQGPIGDGLASLGLDLRPAAAPAPTPPPPAATPPAALPEDAIAIAPPPPPTTEELGLTVQEEEAAIEAEPEPEVAPAPVKKKAKRRAASRRAAPSYDAMMDKALRDAERAAREDMRSKPREDDDEQMEIDLGSPPISGKDLLDEDETTEFEDDPLFELEK